MRRSLLIILLASLAACAWSQDAEREKLRQLELQRENEKSRKIKMQIDSGVYYMELEQYEIADKKFRFVFENLKSIPSDLTYYFGKNSYQLGKYKQSIDWLTKYIQLKGTSGQHSDDAASWLRKAEQALVDERKTESVAAIQVLSRDYVIDCGPAGKVMCPVCSGSTVIVKKNYLSGETYKTCPYCNKHGFLTCDEYNLLLRGQLKAASN